MINKLYDKMKSILKQNYKFFLILIFIFLLFTIKLPYYIDAPGGLIDVSKRIDIEDSYYVEGTLNLAYVLEYRATIPSLIYAYFNKDYDIYKKEEIISSNETLEDINYRDHLMLEEANQNALYVGFTKANKDITTSNEKVFVTYIAEDAITDLKISDQIVKIDEISIENKNHIYDVLTNYEVNDTITLEVINGDETYMRTATLQNIDDRNVIGIMLSEIKDIKTNQEVTFSFEKSESGPSGGFMMALSIYNYLTEEDITNGLKIVGTGTIDMNGDVGSIGGVEYKIKAAVKEDADLFFVPSSNYEEAKQVVLENEYDINLIEVSNIDDAISYLQNLNI